MKGSRKTEAPKEMKDWLSLENDSWKPSYPFNEPIVRKSVVKKLYQEQRGLCVYCGRRLDMSDPGKSFHIEHFRPQKYFANLAVNYDNLFLSCGQHGTDGKPSATCGNCKGDWFDENRHISPVYPQCTQRFRFLLNGEVTAACVGDEAAEEMIRQLGLAHPELATDRRDALLLVDSGKLELSDFWDETESAAESYAHVVYQHLGHLLP